MSHTIARNNREAPLKAPAASIPLGVIMRRSPAKSPWLKWLWDVVAVVPGAPPADWVEMRRDGDVTEFHVATAPLELWPSETEAYLVGLSAQVPSIGVVLREDDERPFDVVLVTASPYEFQDYTDTGEEETHLVPMPDGLVALIRNFINQHHQHEAFKKRRRDRERVDRVEDGKGDARIRQMADVYRAPLKRKAQS